MNREKFNTQRCAKIIELTKKGYSVTSVCDYVGITKKTLYNWLDKGDLGNDLAYTEFAEKYRKAYAIAEHDMTDVVTAVAKESRDSKAAIDWLERQRKKEWRKETKHGIEGNIDMSLEGTLKKIIEAQEKEVEKND
jgi:transposase